ncbi:MAG: OmpA family protein, partial [Pseudomonadales bacterium]|nr:OmpA family protein [Pseudomonadales bacterium]
VLEVETRGRNIIVRVKEHGSFESGSASLTADFKPVLRIIQDVLKETDGLIVVEGHTDSQPIATSRFRSNWELSSGRAVSVAHGLFSDGRLAESRFSIAGYADTRPLVSNETPAGRARNRRVEIVIKQGLGDEVKEELEVLRAEDPHMYERVRRELIDRFELSPEEVF